MTFTDKDLEKMDANREIARVKNEISEKRKQITELKNLKKKTTVDSMMVAYDEAVAVIEKEIESLEKEQDALSESKKSGAKQALRNIIQLPDKLDVNEHRHMIVYISHENKYIHIANNSTDPREVLLEMTPGLTSQQLAGTLNTIVDKPGYFDCLSDVDMRNVFEECNMSYHSITATFRQKLSPLVFNIMEAQRKYWCQPSFEEEYHEMFDDLMWSLGGGNEENITHLEQYYANKFLYPERCATIPNLNISGQPGGNGKLIFMIIGDTIFTSMGVTSAKTKALKSGFNAVFLGKSIVNFDDVAKEEMLHEELKQITGNETITIEFKGMNSFTAYITFNIVVTDNTKSIKVVGGGEDRRWSIIHTDIELVEYVKTKYNLNHEAALDKITDFRMNYASNREEVGKWLGAMIKKHNMERPGYRLLPLHGQDYRNRLFTGKDTIDMVCESMIPILEEQGCLPLNILTQVLNATTDVSYKVNVGKLVDKFNEHLSRSGLIKKYSYSKERIRSYRQSHHKTDRVHHINAWVDPRCRVVDHVEFNGERALYNYDFDFAKISKEGNFRPTGNIYEEDLVYDTGCAAVRENPSEQALTEDVKKVSSRLSKHKN